MEYPKPHAYGFSNGHDNVSRLALDPIEVAISEDGVDWLSYYDYSGLQDTYCYDWDSAMTNPIEQFQKINTQDGQYMTSSSFDSRDISTTWYIDGKSEAEMLMSLRRLQSFFMSRNGLWVVFGNEPSYKYRVKTRVFTPTYGSERSCSVNIVFNNYTGVRESVAKTTELYDMDKEFISRGMGIPRDRRVPWEFNTNTFTVYNPSDVDIDPLAQKHYLKIHIRGSGNLTLTNKTTGEVFTYSRPLKDGDELIIDGVDPILNGRPDGINSNHGIISLKKGDNEFAISGLTNIDITFEFYFVYF